MTDKNLKPGQKVYLTKWALTTGIRIRVAIKQDETFLVYQENKTRNKSAIAFDDDWHTTLEDAQTRVLTMIEEKRKSIAKQLKKLDQLEAEIKAEQGSETL